MFNVDTVLLPLSSLWLHIATRPLRRLNAIVWTCAYFGVFTLIDIIIVGIHCIVQKKKKYFTEHIEYLHPILMSSC